MKRLDHLTQAGRAPHAGWRGRARKGCALVISLLAFSMITSCSKAKLNWQLPAARIPDSPVPGPTSTPPPAVSQFTLKRASFLVHPVAVAVSSSCDPVARGPNGCLSARITVGAPLTLGISGATGPRYSLRLKTLGN